MRTRDRDIPVRGAAALVRSPTNLQVAATEAPISISVVIPTLGRATLLQRAVASALRQDVPSLEVIVVVNGHDPETEAWLSTVDDARLRYLVMEGTPSASRARNAGVQAAAGEWIAFLDDDDEWLPEKLALQLKAALSSKSPLPVVSTRIIVRSEKGDLHWPRRAPLAGEPISEYLFCRTGLFSGDGQLLTSAIFTRRELMLACPFNPEVRKHDDTEWYLTVGARQDTEFLVLPELLTIWHQSHVQNRVSHSGDWNSSLAWARSCRTLMTRKAYASFLLSAVAAEAADTRSFRGLRQGIGEAFRAGDPRAVDLLLPFSFALFPKALRQKARLIAERFKGMRGRRQTSSRTLPEMSHRT